MPVQVYSTISSRQHLSIPCKPFVSCRPLLEATKKLKLELKRKPQHDKIRNKPTATNLKSLPPIPLTKTPMISTLSNVVKKPRRLHKSI